MIRPVFISGRISIIKCIGWVGNVGGKGVVTIPGGFIDSLGPRLGTFPQQVAQRIDPGARAGAQRQAIGVESHLGRIAGQIDLVVDHQLLDLACPDLGDDLVDSLDLAFAVGRAGIDDMQQQVRLGGFLQRGAEGRHQTVRQVADEAHRVGEHHFQTVAQAQTAGERIQRGKELAASAPALVSRLNSVDLPALV